MVVTGHPVYRAMADDPPSSAMISETVINKGSNENREGLQAPFTEQAIYLVNRPLHRRVMMTTAEILDALEAKGVRNSDIARALNIGPSRVTEIKAGARNLKHEEAVKLVETFDLEPASSQQVAPLPASIMRLIALHIATALKVPEPPDSPVMQELVADLAAFSRFVADPQVRESITAAESFFQAMRLRRPAPEPAGPPESDPRH